MTAEDCEPRMPDEPYCSSVSEGVGGSGYKLLPKSPKSPKNPRVPSREERFNRKPPQPSLGKYTYHMHSDPVHALALPYIVAYVPSRTITSCAVAVSLRS